jgi:hypothetical protein
MSKMAKEKEVYITEQTFQDAGGREIFGKLKMVGPVSFYKISNDYNTLDDLYLTIFEREFIMEAKKIEADYVFNVKYQIKEKGMNHIKGTAYKKRGLLRRL